MPPLAGAVGIADRGRPCQMKAAPSLALRDAFPAGEITICIAPYVKETVMRLLIMGPQGVGKGTQAALLAEHYGIPAISTGDIFRYNIKNKTELGLEALKYTDKGELVPDELTNKIVKDRLAMDDAKNGWILDGYPRNASQVVALDGMLAELGTPLDKVVALDADHDVLMERIAKRAAEQGRSDDTPEAIAKRLATYAKETAPLLDTYRSRGQLVAIDGVGDIDEIQANIVEALDR